MFISAIIEENRPYLTTFSMAARYTLSQLWSSQTGESDEDVRKRVNEIKNRSAIFRRKLNRKEFLHKSTEVRKMFEKQCDTKRQNKFDYFNMTQKHLYQVDDLICVSLEREKLKLPFKSSHNTVYLLVKQVFSNERQPKCHLCIRPCETIYFHNSDAKKEVFLVTKQGEYIVHHVQVLLLCCSWSSVSSTKEYIF